ncbi:hypothetical protein GGI04_006218 [Coemansia thaxteri]|nr:hypothetical protein GGI04_006218 [Coemansia thaxteri]KAJ2456986.1 hypothetical protein GGI02_006189 [Coemansia sp. RSA 2322]
MCAILYYLYAKRKNRVKYGDEDVFAKGAHHSSGAPFAQQETHTSPFIPAQHASSGDGYIKEEGPRPAYGTYAPPNPRYQPQQTVPLVQSNSRYVPPPLPPTHGATYATNERDSQFTETYAYEPPQHASARQPPFNPNHHGGGRRA